MYNAKFDRYCLNDIELLAHRRRCCCCSRRRRRRRRRDAINTMELFVFRGSCAFTTSLSVARHRHRRFRRAPLSLSLCRVKFDIELFFSVITLIAPAIQAAPLITGAIAVMSLGRLFIRERARCFYFRRLTRLRSVVASSSGMRVSPPSPGPLVPF